MATKRNPRIYHGVDIDKEAAKVWRLMKDYHKGAPLPTISIRNVRKHNGGISGYAYFWENRITLNIGTGCGKGKVLLVIAHELAHIAAPPKYSSYEGRFTEQHGERWATCYVKAARKRFGAKHFTGVRAATGYAVDNYVLNAIYRNLEASLQSSTEMQG